MDSICVFCGSADTVHPDYLAAARRTGRVLAGRGIRLIYGGGRTGLMGALADGALEAGGEVVGVTVPSMNTPATVRNDLTRLDVAIGPHHRKARMHELAQGYLALPGGIGTFDELFETIAWAQTGEHEKPVGILNVRGYFDPLLAALDHAVAEGFMFPEHRAVLCVDPDPEGLLEAMAAYRHPHEAVKKWMRQG
jgi:uncharacterized protein (TIGR00730 family)